MEEKFTYKSEYFDVFCLISIVVGSGLGLFMGLSRSYTAIILFVAFAAAFALLSVLLYNLRGRFLADDSSVSFYLMSKEVNISYNMIKSVEINREFIKTSRLSDEIFRCIETIKFTCESGRYRFSAFVEIDPEAAAQSPNLLAERLAQSKFSRLKDHINEKTGGRLAESAPEKTEDTGMKNENGEMLFEKTECDVPYRIRTQTIEREAKDGRDVLDRVLEMFGDADEFVTLTVGEARHNIRYVQAARNKRGGGIIVQLGIEDGEHTRLVEKLCGEKECAEIFREFYSTSNVSGRDKYEPVKF